MYVTAQRVVAAGSAREGINAFFHLHPTATWTVPPPNVLEADVGQLVRQSLSIPPGANRVRSYFDVVAADGIPWGHVRVGMMSFVDANRMKPFPWSGLAHDCYFQLGMESSLAREWHSELAKLYRAAQALALV